jgi:hypothetical protein
MIRRGGSGAPWRVTDQKVVSIDYARRASTQTLRQRKAISQWKRLPSAASGALDIDELERKAMRYEYRGGYLVGWAHCLICMAFVAFVYAWVVVGGL